MDLQEVRENCLKLYANEAKGVIEKIAGAGPRKGELKNKG
jgi:hypothetical protein